MVGERNVVQVLARVVRVERAPPAIPALQSQHPLAAAVDGFAEVDAAGDVEADARRGPSPSRRRRCRRDRDSADWRTGTPSRPGARPAAGPPSRRRCRAPAAAPAIRAPCARWPARRRRPPRSAHGTRGPCPTPATRRAGNRPRRAFRTISLSTALLRGDDIAGDRADSRARRTASPYWPSPGKIAPSPSSPFSRSVTNATAFAIARLRGPAGKNGSVNRISASMAQTPQTRDATGATRAARGECAPTGPGKSSSMRHAVRMARRRLHRLQHQQRRQHRASPVGNPEQVEGKPSRQDT